MKKKLLISAALMAFVVTAFITYSCKKDNSGTPSSITNASVIAQSQDAETKDAIADNMEQSLDNNLDVLQENNFATSGKKSGSLSENDGCVSITVDHPDTTFFPKIVTLTYNCADTIDSNGDILFKTGIITVTVSLKPGTLASKWRQNLIRTIDFAGLTPGTGFFVGTDSSSVSVTGTRVVYRTGLKVTTGALEWTLAIRDSVVSELNFTLTSGNLTETFTRNVNRIRTATLYYKHRLIWPFLVRDPKKDNITITGVVTGIDVNDSAYSRLITTPLVITACQYFPYNPVISSGVITETLNNNSLNPITFTYSEAPTGCKTQVVIEKNGKTKTIDRKIRRGFHKWW